MAADVDTIGGDTAAGEAVFAAATVRQVVLSAAAMVQSPTLSLPSGVVDMFSIDDHTIGRCTKILHHP